MRRISDLVSYTPALLLAIALASTAADWRLLVETGGWFALLGHFMMVAATLVLLFLAGVLALCLAALPLVLLFGLNEDSFFALAEARRAGPLATARRFMLAMLNPPWRALWWCWWYARGSLAHVRSR